MSYIHLSPEWITLAVRSATLTYDGSTLLNSQPTTMTQSHSFSSHKSRTVHQQEDYTKTDRPSPGTPLKVTRGQTTLSEYVCENGWDNDPRDSITIHHVRNKQPSDKVFLGLTANGTLIGRVRDNLD